MTTNPRILLVDDDTDILRLLSIRLGTSGYEVLSVESAEIALARIQNFHPHLVITDLQMENMDGMALFEHLHESHPALPVIILTAHGTIPDAIQATKKGVYAYLTKPFDGKQLLETVQNGVISGGGISANDVAPEENSWRAEIIGHSAIMQTLLNQAKLVAASEASVFIQSESGTGKELLAKAIHKASPRHENPFIAVNCAAIPEQLLESELFGHAKGAFTGASSSHKGLVHMANKGTLFLDEIGDMPLTFQAKLLRLLQEREIRPVGSTKTLPVDIRIISATHRDLETSVQDGTFRKDLYYRLNVVMLEIPPLVERREDIPLLAKHFLRLICEKSKLDSKQFSADALTELVSADWPGNVRQLYNIAEQCSALSPSPIIPVALVQKALKGNSNEILPFAAARARFEREYLIQLLQITDGNVTQATRLAHRNRTEFYKLLSRHHLEPKLFRKLKQSEA